MTIELGSKARDTVSGWEGTVTARYEYMNGCIRYEISGANDKGAPEGFVFDEAQVVPVQPPALPDPPPGRTRGRLRGGGSRDSGMAPGSGHAPVER